MAVAGRADPRLRAPQRETHRQLLGRPDAQHALHPAAAVDRARAGAGVAGRGADASARTRRSRWCSRPVRRARDRRRRQAGARREGQPMTTKPTLTEQMHRRRPGRLADRDQAARHQRRRLLQRQLGASVREPDAAVELPRDAGDPADPGGAVLHVRRDGRRHAPGLGGARRHDRRSSCRCSSLCVVRRAGRQPALAALGVDQTASALAVRRQHGRQGGPLRHRQLGALGDRDDRRLERLGQRDARLVHAARRAGADVADAARRGRLRRRRLAASTACSMFAIVAVFIAGLMVGRTPEYLGKKIEAFEMKMASLVILDPAGRRARSARRSPCVSRGRHGERSPTRARTASARSSTPSRRPATTTAAPSPGSSPTRRSTTRRSASRCSFARYWLIIPVLAIAGSLARKKLVPRRPGHAADAHAAVRRAAGRRRCCWSAR